MISTPGRDPLPARDLGELAQSGLERVAVANQEPLVLKILDAFSAFLSSKSSSSLLSVECQDALACHTLPFVMTTWTKYNGKDSKMMWSCWRTLAHLYSVGSFSHPLSARYSLCWIESTRILASETPSRIPELLTMVRASPPEVGDWAMLLIANLCSSGTHTHSLSLSTTHSPVIVFFPPSQLSLCLIDRVLTCIFVGVWYLPSAHASIGGISHV